MMLMLTEHLLCARHYAKCFPCRFLITYLFLNVYLFMFERERERERAQTEEGHTHTHTHTHTESEAGSRLGAVSAEPDVGLEPAD